MSVRTIMEAVKEIVSTEVVPMNVSAHLASLCNQMAKAVDSSDHVSIYQGSAQKI